MKPSFIDILAYQLRKDCLLSTTAAGSGHVTSCFSSADIVATLATSILTEHDEFILSKGHAAPLLYSLFHQFGYITEPELLTLRHHTSFLEGHPTPRSPFIWYATGSLGQGLSIGLGYSLGFKKKNKSGRVFVLLGDMECTEGSIWEAALLAPHYQASNLVAIIDVNRLGQSTSTIDDHHMNIIAARWQGFGWHTLVVDGHSTTELEQALKTRTNKPLVILAKTYKGYGLGASIADQEGFHGKAITPNNLEKFLNELQNTFPEVANTPLNSDDKKFLEQRSIQLKPLFSHYPKESASVSLTPLEKPQKESTRKSFGKALKDAGTKIDNLIVLDAEVNNSTNTDLFMKNFPDRFVQAYIAEQNMIGMAHGFAATGFIPLVATFAAFYSRCFDQLRMSAIGQVPLRAVGSHAGVSIGQDGPSQMGLEDIALFRTLPNSIILYPCDAVSTAACLSILLSYTDGISYLRTTRNETPQIYESDEHFHLGELKALRATKNDQVCVIAAGITVFEALKAQEILNAEGISIRVLDCYSIKPLPGASIIEHAHACNNNVISVEDHYQEGGLGESIAHALASTNITLQILAVKHLPRSGDSDWQLAFANINADAIVQAVKKTLKR
jgi:transketolase